MKTSELIKLWEAVRDGDEPLWAGHIWPEPEQYQIVKPELIRYAHMYKRHYFRQDMTPHLRSLAGEIANILKETKP